MRTSSSRRWLSLVLAACLCVPATALAQDAESLKRDLEAMRQQFEAMKQQYERRMQDLSKRLEQLEAQKAPPAPAAAPPVQTTAPPAAPPGRTAAPPVQAAAPPVQTAAPPAPGVAQAAPPGGPSQPESPSLTDILRPRQPFALAQPGRPLLFDIGITGDFVANFTSLDHERRRDGTFSGRENRVVPRELSLGLFGRVDPYSSAVLRITGAEEEPTGQREAEITARVEEANVSLLTLPFGTTARFGLMRPRFGTLNMVHEDDLPQVDRPDVLRRFFGQEEMNGEKGLEAFWLLPLPFYQELSLGVFNGDNEKAFGRGSLRDPLVLSRLRSFFEFGESGGALQVDISGGTGMTEQDRRNTLAGLGLKYKWFPATGYSFPIITLAAEGIYGNRATERSLAEVAELAEATGDPATAVVRAVERWERWGYYTYAQYDWTKRWGAGLRYDWTEVPASLGRQWALSPYLTFKPSEFLRFRVQYKHTDGIGGSVRDNDEIFLQGNFIMGAHPTERF
jgi:hypothetical protein